jgi:glyoxylase-like metal-dependent hydrolase (beta-lactamase superfamily II)
MKLWSILGNSQKLDGGAMFGNAPRAVWETWLPPDAQNRVPLACRALLASPLNGKTVLFETGIGAFFAPKLRERYGVIEDRHVLLDSLRDAGFAHEQIDVVVLSHLHFDHAGGLLAPWREGHAPELLFPKATFVVSAACWDRARDPHPRDRASFIPELPALLEASGRLEIVDGTYSRALGKTVRFHYSDGHTPGLMLAEIIGPEHMHGEDHGGVVFCADLIPGLRPQPGDVDRREARVPRRQTRPQRASVLHPRPWLRVGAGRARRQGPLRHRARGCGVEGAGVCGVSA